MSLHSMSLNDPSLNDTSLSDVIEATTVAVGADPTRATVRFRAGGHGIGSVATSIAIRQHSVLVDEPASLGGQDAAPSPVEMVLAGLVSCQVVTYRIWAAKLGVQLDTIDIAVEADLDVRGFFGLDEEVRPGFGGVKVLVTLGGPESRESYAELARVVDEHCPVLDLLVNSTAVKTEVAYA